MMSALRKFVVGLMVGCAVAVLTALLAISSVAAQVIPELDPAGCSDRSFVAEPEDYPGLVSDCEALVAIRNHWTNNPANSNLTSSSSLLTWGRGNISTWEGVVITDRSALSASIYSISLYYEGIAGTIPAELAQLKDLAILQLPGNRLTGVVPDALGQLKELWSLDLSYNNLSGSLPAALDKLAPSQGGKISNVLLLRSGISGPIPDVLRDVILRTDRLPPSFQPSDRSTSVRSHSECKNSFKGRFCDEDGSVHETNIETIAELSITLGCSSNKFCPHEYISRAQMAAFLYRAVRHKFGIPEPSEGTWWLADVPDDAWYRPYAEWAVSTHAMESYDVIFNPSGLVTRIEMAEILVYGFPHLFPDQDKAKEGLFADLDDSDYSVAAVHSLYEAGVTSGCSTSPLLYCPDQPVSRGQMASFIVRALTANDHRFDDELGLIAHTSLMRSKSLGNVTWEVWSCEAGGLSRLDLNDIAALFNEQVAPYYLWLSEGRYQPEFVAGKIIQAQDIHSCQHRGDNIAFGYLRDKISDRFLAVIVNDTRYGGGLGGGRAAAVDSDMLEQDYTGEYFGLPVFVHEIGHVLDWPHSFGGLVLLPDTVDPFVNEYDNPMDMMSGCDTFACGTLAINRYAAGWIDPSDVVIYSMPSAEAVTYELSPLGVDGYQMLVIPTGLGQGVFYTLSVRVAKDYDGDIPKQGVEVYFVDQRPEACEVSSDFLCWGQYRTTRPHPPAPADAPLDNGFDIPEFTKHVYQVGDVFFVDEVRVEITERRGDRFQVAVG